MFAVAATLILALRLANTSCRGQRSAHSAGAASGRRSHGYCRSAASAIAALRPCALLPAQQTLVMVTVSPSTCRSSKCSRIQARAAAPCAACAPDCAAAQARPPRSPRGTRRNEQPVTSGTTASREPVESVVITAIPVEAASRAALGNPLAEWARPSCPWRGNRALCPAHNREEDLRMALNSRAHGFSSASRPGQTNLPATGVSAARNAGSGQRRQAAQALLCRA